MMKAMKRSVRVAAAGAVVTLALGVSLAGATAAARFDYASPGPEQVVNVSPDRVNIWTVRFTSTDPLGTQAIVFDKNQGHADTGDTVVDPADHHHFWVALKPNLPPGRYVVAFKTEGEADLDHDGGNYAFYIQTTPTKADLAADSSLSLTTLDDPTNFTGYQRGVVEGGLTLVVILPAGYYIWLKRRHDHHADSPEDLVFHDEP